MLFCATKQFTFLTAELMRRTMYEWYWRQILRTRIIITSKMRLILSWRRWMQSGGVGTLCFITRRARFPSTPPVSTRMPTPRKWMISGFSTCRRRCRGTVSQATVEENFLLCWSCYGRKNHTSFRINQISPLFFEVITHIDETHGKFTCCETCVHERCVQNYPCDELAQKRQHIHVPFYFAWLPYFIVTIQ